MLNNQMVTSKAVHLEDHPGFVRSAQQSPVGVSLLMWDHQLIVGNRFT